MKAPFPWFGGKSKVAEIVWDRFGNVPNYVERKRCAAGIGTGGRRMTECTYRDPGAMPIELTRTAEPCPESVDGAHCPCRRETRCCWCGDEVPRQGVLI